MPGFSTGSGIGIIIAALITGGLISIYKGAVGWPFLALFAVASLVVVTFVNPRGLFLTVVSIPLLYAFFLLLTGTANAYFQLPEGQTSLGRTSVLLILYPLVQFFPVMITTSLGAVAIAILRYQLLKKSNEEIRLQEQRQRRQASESNRRTSREAARSRERTSSPSRVTVEELLARRDQPAAPKRPAQRLSPGTARNQAEQRSNARTQQRATARENQRDAGRGSSRRVSHRLNEDLYGN
nr:Uncharacterised protein [Streptococcus thermophilus]